MRTLMLLAAVTLAMPALAQVPPRDSDRHERVTQIQFTEGDLVEGDTTKPDVEYLQANDRHTKHSNLIRVRDNFRDEALDSAGEL